MTNFDEIPNVTSAIVLALGVWGAIINFAKRDFYGTTFWKRLMFFVFDLLSSAGMAVITFYTLLGYGFNEVMSAGIAGIIAHQGTRAVYLFELIITEKIGAKKTREDIKNDKLL